MQRLLFFRYVEDPAALRTLEHFLILSDLDIKLGRDVHVASLNIFRSLAS